MMRAPMIVAAATLLAACTAQQIVAAQSGADSAVAQTQPTIALACWLVQAADAGFQVYVASSKPDPSVVADETKATQAANAICAAPPANVAQAIADVMGAYKAVVAATPESGGT
ncbi:MAG TPA: hypothetical protein VN802_08680 [Stellaceae bacterium]|nr:hypothetical protein [Stellaceae bacterium]